MSTLSQLCDGVFARTGRVELLEDTKLAVRNAVQFYHLSDFWQKDILEDLKQWTPARSLVQLSIRSTFPRWRKFAYVKKYDLDAMVTKEGETHKITETAPTALFDQYNRLKNNKFYVAGDNFNLRLSTEERALIVGWYTYPDWNDENFQSWIANICPAAIISKAAAEIFNNTGEADVGAAELKQALNVWLPIIRTNDVTSME